MILQQIRHLTTSGRLQRNFFDYEDFTKEPGERPKPPKAPDDFAKAYKRRPLFWMIKGTDVMKEHNQLCLALAGFTFVCTVLGVGWLYYRHSTDPTFKTRKKWLHMHKENREETRKMIDLQNELRNLNLLSNFAKINISMEDYGEIKPVGPQIDVNFDDIFHAGQVLRRKDIGRDLTKLPQNASMKEVDEAIRTSN